VLEALQRAEGGRSIPRIAESPRRACGQPAAARCRPAGTGKSALAAGIAAQKGWKLVAKVVTARTEGRDLLWRFDTVRRLRDAHIAAAAGRQGASTTGDDEAHDLEDRKRYIDQGVLWTAFERSQEREGTVVLVDEIDKADPDVPNSLLEVLGNGRFTVDETGETIAVNDAAPPLVVITTNDERELSRPFRAPRYFVWVMMSSLPTVR
jgi:MoxR-like ATPase